MATAERSERRLDLDRLRVAACLSTFCYHAVQVFDLNPYYHLKSNTLSPAFDVAARLLHAVRMPLFFLIAGMVGALALRRHGNRELMKLRAARLLPPFIVGIVLLTPIVKYYELLGGRSISWRGIMTMQEAKVPELGVFLRRYFTQPRWFSWSHMWFPLYLFLLGGLLLPLMRAIERRDGPCPLHHTAVLASPLAALIAIELSLRPYFPNHLPNLISDWASVSVYVVVMLFGAALVRWPPLEEALQRGLPVTAAITGAGAAIYIGMAEWPWRGIGRAVTLWGCLCVALGLRPLLSAGRIAGERYLADAVLPLYVLHHVPLLAIAYVVKDLPWPIWQRYGVIVLGSFAITLCIYHLIVRPVGFVRLAFGLPAVPANGDQPLPVPVGGPTGR